MFHKEELSNGLRVVTEEIANVHSVALGVWVKTGSRNELPALQGVSHFLEHMMFKGTGRRTARRIAEELDEVGGQLNAFTTKEYTCYYTKILTEHTELGLDILGDMLFHSNMDPREIEKEKNVIIEEIKMYEDSPDELVHDLFAQAVWEGHPLGRAILGTSSTVQQLDHAQIIEYYHQHYTADQIVVAAAGSLKHAQLMRLIEPLFAAVPRGHVRNQDAVPVPKVRVSMTSKDTEQVQVCLGAPGLAQDDKRIYPLQVLNNVLGGGLSSRLFQEIREERGLAYSIYSYHSAYKDTGLFTVYAGTSPHTLAPVLELILQQLAGIKQKGITSEELQRTKQQVRGNLLMGLENITNRMSRLGKTELCHHRVITTEEVLERIEAVTHQDIQELVEIIFQPGQLALTTIGPVIEGLDWNNMVATAGL